jgi:hypothetical protein
MSNVEPIVADSLNAEHTAPQVVFDRAVWLLEEYKLLSNHYFHEDGQLFKAITIFGTLNGALLAFVGSKLSTVGVVADRLIPVIGLFLCFAWLAALVRHREWRIYIECRIREVEEGLHRSWGHAEPLPLDIRTARKWAAQAPVPRWFNGWYRIFREWPASKVILSLPFAFAFVWTLLLLGNIDQLMDLTK